MRGRTEQTVPSIDNAINRRSCSQPSWLILKCHSGHLGIHPQYPRGNRVGIRMGPRTDRRAEGYSPHETCGRKMAWPWEPYIKPVVLAISHHCRHTCRDSHTPPTHTCLCVSVFFSGAFRGPWGHSAWKCVRTFFIDWTVVVSVVGEISPTSQKSFWINHQTSSDQGFLFHWAAAPDLFWMYRPQKVLGPNICKNILWYKQSWEGLR